MAPIAMGARGTVDEGHRVFLLPEIRVNGRRSRERGQGRLAGTRREDLLPQELLGSQHTPAPVGRPTAAHRVTALRAALVTPLSGPLALYGAAGAAALHMWAEHAADLPS